MLLIRLADSENVDVSTFQTEIVRFSGRARWLFCDGGALTTPGTYCHYMVNLLSAPLLLLVWGEHSTLGGVKACDDDDGVITRAMARMVNWKRMADGVIEAECPDFDLVAAFGLFSLESEALRPTPPGNAAERLAKAFKLNAARLTEQLNWVRPVALHLKANTASLSTEDAWSKALTRSRGAGQTAPELRQALLRLLSFGISTSGVERTFALSQWLQGSARTEMADPLVNDELRVVSSSRADDLKIIRVAQQEWARVYGSERQAETPLITCCG